MANKIQSFPYSAHRNAKVLILGSMPGEESLRQQQYYAHPRNLFWDFTGELFGASRELPYEKRLAILRKSGVALWDVAHTCRRQGSLDANMTGVEANNFTALFKFAPEIHTVFFNGQTAAKLFHRLVVPELNSSAAGGRSRRLKFIILPSTSPANASVSRENKFAEWKKILKALGN
ncbi:MAG: DNA-deoxyinosine glycosylase [Kiritimatiellales bacterium]